MLDLSSGVDALASKLRLLQVDYADNSPDEREKHLSDEIDRALGEVLPQHRHAFLARLETRFPTWDIRAEIEPHGPSGPELQADLKKWDFLVHHLFRIAPTLSENERKQLIDRLAEGGLAPPGRMEWPREAVEELREKLGVSLEKTIDAERVFVLVKSLLTFVLGLERAIRRTWREIAGKAAIKRSGDLKETAATFLMGSHVDVKKKLDRLQSLTLGLTNAVAQISSAIATKYMNELSPEAIQASARSPKFMECPPAPLWEKYQELSWGSDRQSIENQIRQLVAEVAGEIAGEIVKIVDAR